ncbi:hypothetical protein [Vagococcus fluvialis]|uniref:hypothetical protein n=1 Tax=Vagococcus fluvialis TaxID=2738 RepID=UPI0037BD9DDB
MKKQDKLDKEIAKKIALEEFNKEHKYHEFSSDYEKNKNKFLSSIDKKKSKKWTVQKIIVAAIALIIIIPTTVFAANELYQWYVTQKEYKLTLSVDGNDTKESTYYKLELGYLPDTMKESNHKDKYSYSDNYDRGGFSFKLWKVKDQAEFISLDTQDYKEVTYGNNEGILVTKVGFGLTKEDDFSRLVYLFFEKEGYVIETYVGNDVPDEDLEKVLANLSLKETTKENATFAIDYEEYKKDFENEPENDGLADSKLLASSSNIAKIGETISVNSFNFTVDSVEILSHIKNLDISNFNDFSIERMEEKQVLSEDLTLKPYIQNIIKRGNGETSVDEIIGETTTTPKFVYITGTLENPTNSKIDDIYLQNSPQLLQQEGKYFIHSDEPEEKTDFSTYSREVDYLDNHGEGKSFYKLPVLNPKEIRTIHFGYFMDEDQLDKMLLPVFNYSNQEDLSDENSKWVDIRK